MNWVDQCLPLVASFEGCARKGAGGLIYPYLDTLAKPPAPTRGYGRCYGITMESPPISMLEARDELRAGILSYGAKVVTLAPALYDRPPCLAAVVSWAWNCGTGAFKVSRLRRAINEGRWDDAARLILKPDTAGGVVYRGLQRRRAAEAALFATGI